MSTYRKEIMRHVDTLSTIYRHIFHSKLPTKSLFVEKKWSKVGPILSWKFQITYKIIICGEIMVKIGTILSGKSSKDPSRLAMCNVYIRNELPTGLPARFNAIQHKGDILPIRTCGDFLCVVCVSILPRAIDMSYRSVNIPTVNNFDNR